MLKNIVLDFYKDAGGFPAGTYVGLTNSHVWDCPRWPNLFGVQETPERRINLGKEIQPGLPVIRRIVWHYRLV
jgi:hypothetical protein